jgi:hypothetical protein
MMLGSCFIVEDYSTMRLRGPQNNLVFGVASAFRQGPALSLVMPSETETFIPTRDRKKANNETYEIVALLFSPFPT